MLTCARLLMSEWCWRILRYQNSDTEFKFTIAAPSLPNSLFQNPYILLWNANHILATFVQFASKYVKVNHSITFITTATVFSHHLIPHLYVHLL
jgi:hypothetical protein